MTVIVTDMAEAQAIGLCWLARQPGLPDIHVLWLAVSQLHATECGWCVYPTRELLAMLDHREIDDRSERAWAAMPGAARLRALELAAGREAAA